MSQSAPPQGSGTAQQTIHASAASLEQLAEQKCLPCVSKSDSTLLSEGQVQQVQGTAVSVVDYIVYYKECQ